MSTLKELVDQYGLPLLVKRPRWYGEYYFKAEKVNSNGMVSGTIYNNGVKGDVKSFRYAEEMVLVQKPATLKVTLTDDKSVYDEENKNLERVESRIDELVEAEWQLYAPYKDEIENFAVYDREDRERLQALREIAEPHKQLANEYRAYKPNPYFMRVDIDIDQGEETQYFIGTKGLMGDNGIIIYDWQSPVAYAARFTNSQRFQADGHECNLYLRRKIEIKDEKIELVNTDFEVDSVTLEGEVIDPFLLSVLRDKRRDYKLTDIIRTIQHNQSEIISKPIQESFILQGCAGSGKTMILLHRLSYLLYNHKNVDVSHYCILTPNEYFNRHIDELSRELEIDKIKRYTVEEYYVQLIERLSLDDYDSIQENNSWVRIPKIKLPSAKLKSEKGLHDSMLSEIYSLDYQAELKRIYEDLWNRFEETVKPYDFGEYVQATKTGLPVITNHTYETYRRIRAFYMELLAAVTQHENEIRAAKEGLRRIDRVLPEYRQRLADAELSMVETKSKIHDRMTEMLDGIRQQDKEMDRGTDERVRVGGVGYYRILKTCVGTTREALSAETTRVYGFARAGQNISLAMTSAVDYLIKMKRVEEPEGKLRVIG